MKRWTVRLRGQGPVDGGQPVDVDRLVAEFVGFLRLKGHAVDEAVVNDALDVLAPAAAPPPPAPPPPPPPVVLAGPDYARGIADARPAPQPPLTLPAAGGVYVDPVFRTRISRVTNAAALGKRFCVHNYSTPSALNLDSTRLLVAHDNVCMLYSFDPATLASESMGPLTGGSPVTINWQSAVWSGRAPNILHVVGGDGSGARRGVKIWRCDVSQPAASRFTVVRDFTTAWPGAWEAWQLSVSDDDDAFCFHTRDANDRRRAVVYIAASNEVAAPGRIVEFPDTNFGIDECVIDGSGKLVVVVGDERFPYQILFWDVPSNRVVDRLIHKREDQPGGHLTVGATTIVNSDIWLGGLVRRNRAALHAPVNFIRYTVADKIADHVAFPRMREDYVVASTHVATPPIPFAGEVYIAEVASGRYARLCHTRSTGAKFASSDEAYWAQPRVSPSPDGRFAVFASDNNTNRVDTYVLEIPQR